MKLLFALFLVITLSFGHTTCAQEVWLHRTMVKGGMQVILRDTSFTVSKDTILYLTQDLWSTMRIKINPYAESTNFYDTLQQRSAKNKFSKSIISLIVKRKKRKEVITGSIVKSENVFKAYQGMRINEITYKSVDLLEGSVIDTTRYATTHFGKFINKLHRDTRKPIIKNNLLFAKGEKVDAFTMSDNERILRQLPTLRDARIYLMKDEKDSMSANVVVVTQDVTSIGVSGDFNSVSNYRFDVYDINMLGYARQLRVSYFRNSTEQPINGFELTIKEPNLLGTFLQGNLQYTHNYLRQQTSISLGRDFFTPAIKYAGGVEWYRTKESFYFEAYDTFKLPYTENAFDLWAGRSIEFKKRSNLILALRWSTKDFVARPWVASDSNAFFHNRNLLLSNIALVRRNYLRSLYIRGFGKTEDIPVGGSLSLLLGSEYNQFTDRQYVALVTSFGKYVAKLGYINLNFNGGSFVNAGEWEQGLINLGSTYFSNLFKVRRTKMRQFVFVAYTRGYNRLFDRTLSLERKWRDANDLSPLGKQRLLLGLETVHFMPWYRYGFQFALFNRIDLSLLSFNKLLMKQNTFASFRVGLRTLNENLVLPLLALEVAYFVKTGSFSDAWEIRFSTTLPRLFTNNQNYKPSLAVFNE